MKLLVIGGTQFVGRHLTEDALRRGWKVTLFNRGQTNPALFPEAEQLVGDRDGGLDGLRGRKWDAVMDTCGYVPRVVQQSTELLRDAVERYVFISTLSVYSDLKKPNQDEEGELARLQDETVEEVTGETYGGLKVLCERVVQQIYGERGLVIRPGLIVGPHDPTNRFTYWPARVEAGGDVLAPGPPERPVQFIDARDLAGWILDMTEAGSGGGVYNATGPASPLSAGELLQTCKDIAASDARFTWVDDAFLLGEKVEPYSELPLWLPG
jgi:nucleoside-diphosphate-sugar epimerase